MSFQNSMLTENTEKELFSLYLKKDIVIHLTPSHRADRLSSVLRPLPTFPCTPTDLWNEHPRLGRNIVLTQPCRAPSPAVTLSQGPWCPSPAKKELLGSTPSIAQAQNPKPIHYLTVFLFWFIYIIWCVNALATCIYVNHMCAWCPKRPKEDIRYPRTG